MCECFPALTYIPSIEKRTSRRTVSATVTDRDFSIQRLHRQGTGIETLILHQVIFCTLKRWACRGRRPLSRELIFRSNSVRETRCRCLPQGGTRVLFGKMCFLFLVFGRVTCRRARMYQGGRPRYPGRSQCLSDRRRCKDPGYVVKNTSCSQDSGCDDPRRLVLWWPRKRCIENLAKWAPHPPDERRAVPGAVSLDDHELRDMRSNASKSHRDEVNWLVKMCSSR